MITGTTTIELINTLDVFSSQALLLTWFKVLYFMKGMDSTSSIVHMLFEIVSDVQIFIVVLCDLAAFFDRFLSGS